MSLVRAHPRTIALFVAAGVLLGAASAWRQGRPNAQYVLSPLESAASILPEPKCQDLEGEPYLQCQASREVWAESLDPVAAYVQAMLVLRSNAFARQYYRAHLRDRDLRLRRSYRTLSDFQDHLDLVAQSIQPGKLTNRLVLSGYALPQRADALLNDVVQSLRYAAAEAMLRSLRKRQKDQSLLLARIPPSDTSIDDRAQMRRRLQGLRELQRRVYIEMPMTFQARPIKTPKRIDWRAGATAGGIFGLLAGILAATLWPYLPRPGRSPRRSA